jgi:hypothetical protein
MPQHFHHNHIGPFDTYLETLRQGALYTRVVRRYKVWNGVCKRWDWFLVIPVEAKFLGLKKKKS